VAVDGAVTGAPEPGRVFRTRRASGRPHRTGIAALATIIANDLGQQERLLPLVDLADVRPSIRHAANTGIEAVIAFDLVNDGGGPAKEVRLTLAQYGDDKDLGVSYLGSISPGQRRHYTGEPFKLPLLVHGKR